MPEDVERVYGAAAVMRRVAKAPSLRAITLSVDGGPVGEGGSGARYMTSTGGERWIVKSHILGGHSRYLCLNEAVCAQVAVRIGVVVPEAAVVELDGEQLEALKPGTSTVDRYLFASKHIENAEPLSEPAADATSTASLAGIVVLDTLTRNTDRKPEHVLSRFREDGSSEIWSIDHGHAITTGDSIASFQMGQPSHPPIDLLKQRVTLRSAEPFIETAQAIGRAEFVAMVEGLPEPWVIEPDAAQAIADVLIDQVKRLPDLLRADLGE